MTNAKAEESDKGDEEVTDVAKEDAKKTSEVKDDTKKIEPPPTSLSLSISSGFGAQFVKLSSDYSLVSAVKDSTNANLRVAKLEKDVFDLKKIDLFAEALAALKTQVPSVVDNYLVSKVADILKIKREKLRWNRRQSLLSCPQTRQLSKTLIEDENAMDKGVADIVKDHKRKHDDDDDDDEDPPAQPNQGKKTKRRRTKDSDSSKKPSSTKETPKSKASSKGSKTGKSSSTKEPVEEPIDEVVMDDVGNYVVLDDDQPQDASEPKTTKTPNPEWFKQPPRPPTPDPE
ncbi:hypothetical protein Tco_1002540 [Tanacetum coccineum]|uniref:Uncharacterized protein n=1 Tax=Tanacetum coccineum TaxID=301880 RepID=A0ABQ5F8E5_9ASTR